MEYDLAKFIERNAVNNVVKERQVYVEALSIRNIIGQLISTAIVYITSFSEIRR